VPTPSRFFYFVLKRIKSTASIESGFFMPITTLLTKLLRLKMSENQQIPPQFQHVKRYWDPVRKIHVAKILPGELYVTRQHELISTLLGSCVAVCMRDRVNKIGGMNHFKLPAPEKNKNAGADTNYGNFAMELLINEILRVGGVRKNLECHVFGGGNVVRGIRNNIGGQNLDFVLDFLQKEKISILSQDVGHGGAQNVYYHVLTGNAFATVSENSSMEEVRKMEKAYMEKVEKDLGGDGIVYF
jgi:chemotaxis protein CheD